MSWYKNEKQAQFDSSQQGIDQGVEDPTVNNIFQNTEQSNESRYKGTMTYDIRVPYNQDPQAELIAAEQEASELFDRVWQAVGDEVPFHNPPEKVQ